MYNHNDTVQSKILFYLLLLTAVQILLLIATLFLEHYSSKYNDGGRPRGEPLI